jgi:hypothetical protein
MDAKQIPLEFEEGHEAWLAGHMRCLERAEPSAVECDCGPRPCRGCGKAVDLSETTALCAECAPKHRLISLEMSEDEAIVLFELLARFDESEALSIAHVAEERMLWDISGSLEKLLVAPFASNYRDLLTRARDSYRYEDELPQTND